jgi:hypothetical protein
LKAHQETNYGFYTRSPQDLPIAAKIVRLQPKVRRFRCHHSSCAKCTFSERLPDPLQPYAQKTERFITALYHTAQALGGAAAARLLLLLQFLGFIIVPVEPNSSNRL